VDGGGAGLHQTGTGSSSVAAAAASARVGSTRERVSDDDAAPVVQRELFRRLLESTDVQENVEERGWTREEQADWEVDAFVRLLLDPARLSVR
jgi:tripartite-type tricarboxylate transporter receptor subunit TctC